MYHAGSGYFPSRNRASVLGMPSKARDDLAISTSFVPKFYKSSSLPGYKSLRFSKAIIFCKCRQSEELISTGHGYTNRFLWHDTDMLKFFLGLFFCGWPSHPMCLLCVWKVACFQIQPCLLKVFPNREWLEECHGKAETAHVSGIIGRGALHPSQNRASTLWLGRVWCDVAELCFSGRYVKLLQFKIVTGKEYYANFSFLLL